MVERTSEATDLQAIAARVRALSRKQVDAATSVEMKDLLDTVAAARRALEADRSRCRKTAGAVAPKSSADQESGSD